MLDVVGFYPPEEKEISLQIVAKLSVSLSFPVEEVSDSPNSF